MIKNVSFGAPFGKKNFSFGHAPFRKEPAVKKINESPFSLANEQM